MPYVFSRGHIFSYEGEQFNMSNTRPKSTQVAIDAIASKSKRRSKQERARISTILLESFSFVPSPLFGRRNSHRLIFDDVEAVPRKTVSWYCPAVDIDASKPIKSGVLLTRAQEIILFRQYNFARKKVQKLQKVVSKTDAPKDAELDALLEWYDIATEKRDHIVECNLALVLAMAKRTWATGEYADLVAEGNVAMLRCVERFDCELGFKFSTYACRALTTAFNRFGGKQAKYKSNIPFDIEATKEPLMIPPPVEVFASPEHVKIVQNAIRNVNSNLTPVEQDVLRYRFGVHAGQNPPQLTLEKAGKQLGISKERVRQLQIRALQKIRDHIEFKMEHDLLAS